MTIFALAATVAMLVLLPPAVDLWAAPRASPVLLVTLSMVSLAGLALVPVALAICVAELGWGRVGALGSWALGAAAVTVGTATVGRAVLVAWRAMREWRRIASAVDAAGTPTSHGVTLVPLESPTAFTAGGRVVVSTALTAALDAPEIEAVIAHEQAHLKGGHPRIACWAHALQRATFGVPMARAAEERIRQQLEILADRRAAQHLRDPGAVREAVARLSCLAPTGFGDPAIAELADRRIACLRRSPHHPPADQLTVAAIAAVAAAAFAVVCGALHLRLATFGVVLCGLSGLGLWQVLRPLYRV